MKANIGFVLVDSAVVPGSLVSVARDDGPCGGRLVDLPFL
jgi:hypothetical protein